MGQRALSLKELLVLCHKIYFIFFHLLLQVARQKIVVSRSFLSKTFLFEYNASLYLHSTCNNGLRVLCLIFN